MGRRANSDRPPQPGAHTGPPRQNRLLVCAVCGFLLAAVAVVFGQTVWHGFVNYDDSEYVFDNPHINQGCHKLKEIVWVHPHAQPSQTGTR